MTRQAAEPLAHEITGADLSEGMMTFQRYLGRDEQVHFRPDCLLIEEVPSCGITAKHFRTPSGKVVCYNTVARLFAKKLSDDEILRYANGNTRDNSNDSALADQGNGKGASRDKRRGDNRQAKAPRRDGTRDDKRKSRVVHGERSEP